MQQENNRDTCNKRIQLKYNSINVQKDSWLCNAVDFLIYYIMQYTTQHEMCYSPRQGTSSNKELTAAASAAVAMGLCTYRCLWDAKKRSKTARTSEGSFLVTLACNSSRMALEILTLSSLSVKFLRFSSASNAARSALASMARGSLKRTTSVWCVRSVISVNHIAQEKRINTIHYT